jgi:hypothetical protein
MNDITRLETALINADAAGDAEAAAFLAGEVRKAREGAWQGTPVPQRKEPGMADYAEDAAKSFALSGLPKGVTGLMGLPGDVQGLVDKGVDYLGSKIGLPPPAQDPTRQPRGGIMPNTQQVRQGVQSVTGDFYKPQYRLGRYADSVGEMIPGAAMGPGGAIRNTVAFGVVPGIASQAAGEATGGNPWAKGGAAVASGGLMAMLTARGAGGAGASVGRAGGGQLDNAVLQQAEAIFQEAQQLGIPITRAEAVQHVTNGGTAFGNLQRVAEGQGAMKPFFAERAGLNDAAAGRAFDQVTPAAPNPSAIGPAVGTAAENTINDVRGVINQASEPFYRQAAGVRVPGAEMARIRNAPGWAEARDAVRNDPQLNRYVRNLPENSIGFLDEVKKYLRTQADNVAAPVNQQRNMQRSAGYGDDATLMRDVAVDTSRNVPAATMSYGGRQIQQAANPYETALNIQTQAREQYLQPLLDGPLGKIASRDTTTQNAINTLFPNNPLPNSAQEIETAVRAVAQRNPYAARQLVRAHLEMTFNEATQNLASGANSFGGAKFAAVVRGNPQQAQNLEAAVRALPRGDQIWPGVDRFMTILEAQGQRQAIGSQTAFNQTAQQALKSGSVAGEAASTVASVGMKFPQRVKDAIETWRLGNNVDELARLFADPNAGREFARLATANNPGAINASVFRLTMLAKTGAGQSSGPKDQGSR